LIAYVEVCKDNDSDREVFTGSFLPSIISQVLTDFHTSPPSARDPKVLTFFSTSIVILKDLIAPDIPKIMDAVFEKTIEMISTNMLDYPEHRIEFFKFLNEANQHCFHALFSIPSHHQKLVIDSIVWAFKHTERNISETGFEILLALLQNLSENPTIAQPFYVTFLVSLIHDILGSIKVGSSYTQVC
jgi:exportin-1